MKIVEPSVEVISEMNPLKRIELCGRVCYKSEDRITDTSAKFFVARMIRSGHTSVLEHARIKVYSKSQADEFRYLCDGVPKTRREYVYGSGGFLSEDYLTVNVRDYINAVPNSTVDDIAAHELECGYFTVRFVCDRAIANELVRHRVFSFSQESTRYVSYKGGVQFVRPVPFEWATNEESAHFSMWYNAMFSAECAYRAMVSTGLTPQQARDVLPLSTKTELVMSGLPHQWSELLRLRLAPSAHPQMVHLMKMLVEKIPSINPELEKAC